MSDVEFRNAKEAASPEWSGLVELDRALAENRLTEYRFRKALSDPIERGVVFAAVVGFVGVLLYLGASSAGLW